MEKRFDTLDDDGSNRLEGAWVPKAGLLFSLEYVTISGLGYLRAKHTSILFKS